MMVLILLLCVSTAIFSQGSAQTENCPLITESELGSTTAHSNVGVVPIALQSPDVNQLRHVLLIYDYQITCSVAGTAPETYQRLSIVVALNCRGRTSSSGTLPCDAPDSALGGEGNFTVQIDMRCTSTGWKRGTGTILSLDGNAPKNSLAIPANATLDTALDSQCKRCVNNRLKESALTSTAVYNDESHCVYCKAACRSVGLRLCTLATQDCCSFYHDTGSGFACTNECPPGVSPNETFFCIADCGVVPDVENGVVSYHQASGGRNETQFESIANYSCSDGYALTESGPRMCQSNGNWSGPAPACERACTSLSAVADGNVTFSQAQFVGSVASYHCNTGFNLIGSGIRYCQESGNWNQTEPFCEIVTCPQQSIMNGRVSYSEASVGRGETEFGASVTYTCNNGYILQGIFSRECLYNATWSGLAPVCERICPYTIADPVNGTLTVSPSGQTHFFKGTVATYECDDLFTLNGIAVITCQSDGTWSGPEPTCQLADCGKLSVDGGQVSYTKAATDRKDTEFGAVAIYMCSSDFVLKGNSTRECLVNGSWSGSKPTCERICPNVLSAPANGSVSVNSTDQVHYIGTVATYTCNTSLYLVGGRLQTCLSDGTWSVGVPTCRVPGDCGELESIENGEVVYNQSIGTGTVATYICSTTYTLSGTEQRECLINATWSGSEPACDPTGNSSLITIIAAGAGAGAVLVVILLIGIMLALCSRKCKQKRKRKLDEHELDETPRLTFNWMEEKDEESSEQEEVEREHTAQGVVGQEHTAQSAVEQERTVQSEVEWERTVQGAVGQEHTAQSEVGQEHTVQSEVEHLPPTTDIVAVHTAAAWEDAEAKYTEAKSAVVPSVKQYTNTIRVWEGQEINIKVEVVGYPHPTIEWIKEGVRLEADYTTKVHQDGSVTIQSAERRHGGQYHFITSNTAGKVEGDIRVVIEEEEDEREVEKVLSSAIEVERFGEYVAQNHAKNNVGFRVQYQTGLPSGEEGHTTLIGKCPEHKKKNRFKNIIPYDSSRILLNPIEGCEDEDCQHNYINASYIDGYSQKRKFIASQGPVQRTLTDFWRLVWQEEVPMIVMVTNLTEGNTKKCTQYWPEPGCYKYGPFSVSLIEKMVFADFIIRNFRLSVGESDVREVTHFHFTSWPDHGVPEYAGPVLSFHRRIKAHSKITRGPVLVHCSAGVGRTGTILAIDIALDQATSEGIVDVPAVVGGMRKQRMKMVQTSEQYVFIHDAVLEFLICGNTQIPTPDLNEALHCLQQCDESKQSTGFGIQFQVLEQVSPKPDEIVASCANLHPQRNRSHNFLPLDLWRVALKAEKPNYIHASFVNGYKKFKGFVIAQAPMGSTCRDFWKMVYDTQCRVIVMLSDHIEEGEEVCHKYWPESEAQSYNDYIVTAAAESKHGGYTKRIFEIKPPKSEVRKVTQFQLSCWSREGLCEDPVLFMEFIEVVGVAQRRSGNQPLVVHGKDTVSRCGVFCALLNTIECCKTEGIVDVFQMVKALRIQKPGAVCTVVQYTFLFDMMKRFLDSFTIYSNFK